jgi:hypothetical protein
LEETGLNCKGFGVGILNFILFVVFGLYIFGFYINLFLILGVSLSPGVSSGVKFLLTSL